jgi:hypothetical protein
VPAVQTKVIMAVMVVQVAVAIEEEEQGRSHLELP